jgi:nucleotide sugar dehydrogenase
MNEPSKIAVIGLGYVGQPTMAALLAAGFSVVGIDTDAALVDQIRSNGATVHEPGVNDMFERYANRTTITTDYAEASKAQTVVVTVGTPLSDSGVVDLNGVNSVVNALGPHLVSGQLILFRSTVPPGSTHRSALALAEHTGLQLGESLFVAFSPERTAEGVALYETQTRPTLVGGVDPESTTRAANFLRQVGGEILTVSSPEIAETAKLVENTHRAVNIAFANEIGRLCEGREIDAHEVMDVLKNSAPRTSFFKPGLGAAGPCLSKDPTILAMSAHERAGSMKVIEAAISTNLKATAREVEELETFVAETRLERVSVAILGAAFKGFPETDDTRGAPSLEVLKDIRAMDDACPELEFKISAYDPIVETLDGLDVSFDLEDVIQGSNVILFMNEHPSLRELRLSWIQGIAASPLLIVDAWHNLTVDVPLTDIGTRLVRVGGG